MRARAGDFDSELELTLTGIAIVPEARAMLNARLDELWNRNSEQKLGQGSNGHDEVIIGAGLHAAVYSAARVSAGFRAPLVLEASTRVGGAFAMSDGPAFYANSRNRPGPIGMPGDNRGLNVIPGASLQPANLSASEFQRNNDIAFCIRTALGQYARVVPNSKVIGIIASPSNRRYDIALRGGGTVLADRVIDARGIGDIIEPEAAGVRIVTFQKFMRLMDLADFPLRGLDRVAVVGPGDSGKCAIEGLLGMSPAEHLSVPNLDFVREIDWYAPRLPTTCEEWRTNIRGRYLGIGSYLRKSGTDGRTRVTVIPKRGEVSPGFNCAYVNEKPYDMVIYCCGYRSETLPGVYQGTDPLPFGKRAIAKALPGTELYQIGPAAGLDFTSAEQNMPLSAIPENRTAVFRLAGRTAALAATLKQARPERERKRPMGGSLATFQKTMKKARTSGPTTLDVTVQRADRPPPDFDPTLAIQRMQTAVEAAIPIPGAIPADNPPINTKDLPF